MRNKGVFLAVKSALAVAALSMSIGSSSAAVLPDPRDPDLIVHSQLDMLRQRVYAMVQGYEDLNDHGELRSDTLLQSVLDRDKPLASAPTLCRLENRASRAAAWALHGQLINTFIASFSSPPFRDRILSISGSATSVRPA